MKHIKHYLACAIGIFIGVSFLIAFGICYCVYFVTIKPIEWAFSQIEVDGMF